MIACRPKPYVDELLSSWLLRTALRNGMKPQSFCKLLWPEKTFWNRSIDRHLSLETLEKLSFATATPVESLSQLSLASFEGVLFPELVRNGNTPWVLPLGIFHRKFRRSGLVFCPHCLSETEPYFRQRWRLSFATVCLTHGTPLQESCPNCNAPIQPHRVEVGSRNPYTDRPLYVCSTCSFDLRASSAACFEVSTQWTCEHESYAYLKHGNERDEIGAEHFGLLRHLLSMLASRRSRLGPLRATVAQELGAPLLMSWKQKDPIAISFDAMQLADRRIFLGAAYWLMKTWPDRFLCIARRANLRTSDLTRDFPHMPASFLKLSAKLKMSDDPAP